MGVTLHEGWVIITFNELPPRAGLLRYEQVGGLCQWVLDVPASHNQGAYHAFIDPLSVKAITPCTEAEALKFAAELAAPREPPAA